MTLGTASGLAAGVACTNDQSQPRRRKCGQLTSAAPSPVKEVPPIVVCDATVSLKGAEGSRAAWLVTEVARVLRTSLKYNPTIGIESTYE